MVSFESLIAQMQIKRQAHIKPNTTSQSTYQRVTVEKAGGPCNYLKTDVIGPVSGSRRDSSGLGVENRQIKMETICRYSEGTQSLRFEHKAA